MVRIAPLLVATLLAVALTAAPAPGAGDADPFLLELPGTATSVRYLPGSLDRAAHVQERFELLARDFARWSGQRVALALVVLPRAEWESMVAERPYGLPAELGGGVALPAEGDSGTVELWRRLLGGPPPVLAGEALGSSPEEVATLAAADLLAQVEAARLLLAGAGYSWDEAWVGEVAAHLVAASAFARHEPARLAEIDRFFASLGRDAGGTALERWLVGQASCASAARGVMAQTSDRGAAHKLLKSAGREHLLRAAEVLRRFPPAAGCRP